MKWSGGILLLFFLMQAAFAQTYPEWFTNPLSLDCSDFEVGMANVSYYPDSSASAAIKDTYYAWARHQQLTVVGGQGFFQTVDGVHTLQNGFLFRFDSTRAQSAASLLVPADTLFSASLTAVLLVNKACIPLKKGKRFIKFKGRGPAWLKKLPSEKGFVFAVGTSEAWYYEYSSWKHAEQNGLIALAKSLYSRVKGVLFMDGDYRSEERRVGKECRSRWSPYH